MPFFLEMQVRRKKQPKGGGGGVFEPPYTPSPVDAPDMYPKGVHIVSKII